MGKREGMGKEQGREGEEGQGKNESEGAQRTRERKGRGFQQAAVHVHVPHMQRPSSPKNFSETLLVGDKVKVGEDKVGVR